MNAKQYTTSAKKQCKQKGNANSHIQAAIHLHLFMWKQTRHSY